MKLIRFVAAILFVFVTGSSCKKLIADEPSNNSRVVRYEVTGNFTGTLFASYTTADGGTANDPVTSLPWIKEITYDRSVTAANLAFSGNGGVAGQQVTLVTKRGGERVSSTDAVAGSSGSFTVSAFVMVF